MIGTNQLPQTFGLYFTRTTVMTCERGPTETKTHTWLTKARLDGVLGHGIEFIEVVLESLFDST